MVVVNSQLVLTSIVTVKWSLSWSITESNIWKTTVITTLSKRLSCTKIGASRLPRPSWLQTAAMFGIANICRVKCSKGPPNIHGILWKGHLSLIFFSLVCWARFLKRLIPIGKLQGYELEYHGWSWNMLQHISQAAEMVSYVSPDTNTKNCLYNFFSVSSSTLLVISLQHVPSKMYPSDLWAQWDVRNTPLVAVCLPTAFVFTTRSFRKKKYTSLRAKANRATDDMVTVQKCRELVWKQKRLIQVESISWVIKKMSDLRRIERYRGCNMLGKSKNQGSYNTFSLDVELSLHRISQIIIAQTFMFTYGCI